MSRSGPHKAGTPLRAPPDALQPAVPLPLYHHPVIALSLVLMAGCAAQIVVWLVNLRLPPTGIAPPSGPAVHGHLFTVLQQGLTQLLPEGRAEPALFVASLTASMLSAAAWYAVARVGIGPAWGLWTALLWAVHPSFAFLAQRSGPLALMVLLAPVSLGTLLWWRRSRRRRTALLAGTAMGLLAMTGMQGLLVPPLALVAMLTARVKRSTRFRGVLWVGLGFCLVLATASKISRPPFQLSEVMRDLHEDWRRTLDDGDSPTALAARKELMARPAEPLPSPARFLFGQLRQSPGTTLHWFASRLWRCVYATANGRLQRPLFAIQILLVLPALWGLVVALRFPPWRWPAALCCMYLAVFWLVAGLIEPLARNLTPIGGVPVLFALIGAADIYERLFGRRLTGGG